MLTAVIATIGLAIAASAGAGAHAEVALAAASPGAQPAFHACEGGHWECGHLTVPLDPSGTLPGTVTLAMHRRMAAHAQSATAILVLAGGPGQAALPFTEQMLELLGVVAGDRDVILLDQRGTGFSGPLSCHAFEASGLYSTLALEVESCASQIGAARSLYTSTFSAADIEAVRAASGYRRLVLFGTSYGTKVAELYARAHPEQTEALILDSPVTPEGPETLARPTFAAIRGVMGALCARRACRGITRSPLGDLSAVLASARAGRLRGRVVGGRGAAREVRIGSGGILGALLQGDFAPPLRAALLSADAAAVHGDTAPLARLLSLAGGSGVSGEDLDAPLYYATTCEEQGFPWSRTSTPARRLAEARAAATAAARAFTPFTPAEAIALGDAEACFRWPYGAGPAPAPALAPGPRVPTLVLSGGQDIRTPTAEARRAASLIPGARLLVVPAVGHGVLEEDGSGCALRAVATLLGGSPAPCMPPAPSLRPAPLPPRALSALAPAGGVGGRAGITIAALKATVADLGRTLALELEIGGEGPLALGGLRAGWAQVESARLQLHGYSYVPGVSVSGSLSGGAGELRIHGGGSAPGALRSSGDGIWQGALGGVPVRLSASALASAAIVGGHAEAGARKAGLGAGGAGGGLRAVGARALRSR